MTAAQHATIMRLSLTRKLPAGFRDALNDELATMDSGTAQATIEHLERAPRR